MKESDPKLLRWYRSFNRKFFHPPLPDAALMWSPCDGDFGLANQEEDGTFFIKLNPQFSLDERMAKMTLLHEMCHLAIWPIKNHGKKWKAQMLRLAQEGAFDGLW